MRHEPIKTDATRLDRRKFAIGLLLGSAAAVAAARQPSVQVDYLGKLRLEDVVPEKLGDWKFVTSSGLVVPPEDQLSRLLYSQVLTRVYTDDAGARVMLLVAQSPSQTGVLQIHRPELCYGAAGYQVSPVQDHRIPLRSASLVVNSLTATAPTGTEHILYWTRIGNHMPKDWAEQRWVIASDNLRGMIPDAVLIRVSVIQEDRKSALATMDRFVQAFFGTLPAATQRVFRSQMA